MSGKVVEATAVPSSRLGGWLNRAAVLVPALIAGLTNGMLIVVSIINHDDTVLVVASIGIVVVGMLGVVADSTLRATDDLSKRLKALELATHGLGSGMGAEQAATREGMGLVTSAVGDLAENVGSLIRQSRVISREDFYEMAIRLVHAPPSRESTVRVFNLFGIPPSRPGTDAQSRWFSLVETFDEDSPPINFRRIKLVADERSMTWTLETLIRNIGRRNFNMAIVSGGDRSLAYPLNAHSYYGKDAFILLPGRSSTVSDPDDPVIHITNRPEVEVLTVYHDNLFASCDAKCEQGRVVVEDWRRFAEQHGFGSPAIEQLLDELGRASDV